jgi:hypothetical protein
MELTGQGEARDKSVSRGGHASCPQPATFRKRICGMMHYY